MERPMQRPLDLQVQTLTDAETAIRKAVRDAYLSRLPKATLNKAVARIIADAIRHLRLPVLRDTAMRSLRSFAERQWTEINRIGERTRLVLASLLTLEKARGEAPPDGVRNLPPVPVARKVVADTFGYDRVNVYGLPLKKNHDAYIKNDVVPVLNRLCAQEALDPDDVSGRNSLRNRAEMEVRYNGHLDNIAELREAGHRLVIASAHANCSPRCRPWQGRVYSLDHTSGTTEDGREFVPLETATDVPYPTKAGKVYMNGLLGFNCRHYLVEYKPGFRFPRPMPDEEKRQYRIDMTQRRYERAIRREKIVAITKAGTDRQAAKEARENAKRLTEAYEEYSKQHERAFYRSRITIL